MNYVLYLRHRVVAICGLFGAVLGDSREGGGLQPPRRYVRRRENNGSRMSLSNF